MIFILRDGKQDGPFTELEVRDRLMAREFAVTDLVWQEGLPSWIPISTLLGIIPPPPSPLNQAPSPGVITSSVNWLDAPVEIICPKCADTHHTKIENCFREGITCKGCGSKSQKKQWVIREVDPTLVYRRTWKDFLFSDKGRLNRTQFFTIWLAFWGIMFGWYFCYTFFFVRIYPIQVIWALGPLVALAFFLTCGIVPIAKRLQDRGIKGNWVWNLVIGFIVLMLPTFGQPTPVPSAWLDFAWFSALGRIVIVLLLFVAVLRRGDDDCNMFGPPTKRIVTGNNTKPQPLLLP